jgi:phospholipase/carboxylesterase
MGFDPESGGLTRRHFSRVVAAMTGTLAFGGACYGSQAGSDGRITARARSHAKTFTPGSHPLGLAKGRDGIIQVPKASAAATLPLSVLLHGAGGNATGILRRLGQSAAEAGVVVLAPDSRDDSWDAIRDDLGPDVLFLTRALERAFEQLPIDPDRVSIGGFSDGATYALTLGLINGDLFRRIVAFSPGFIVQRTRRGQPKIFMSHGTGDEVLPIERCSRRLAPALQNAGYEVTYREFPGGHTVPAEIAREGMKWAAG